jgi:predicted GTPase
VDTAPPPDVLAVRRGLHELNPRAVVVEAASPVRLSDPEGARGKRVLVVEDGPTLTHGGAAWGAGWLAAREAGAVVVDPRPFAVGTLQEVYRRYPHLGPVLPAMGYSPAMIGELEETINRADADLVIVGTPIDLGRFLRLEKPTVRARYEIQEVGEPSLEGLLEARFRRASGPGR